MRSLTAVLLAVLLLPVAAFAGEWPPVVPSAKDKCPVCGMVSAAFPDFLSQIIFADGSYVTFDGPKDMFRYLLRRKDGKTIGVIYVKDYYSLNYIDARQAFFVTGSDVYGPMGKELIPFSDKEDAKVFKKDHRGREILHFKDVTAEKLNQPDTSP